MNHLIEFEEPMNTQTCKPTCKPVMQLMIEQVNDQNNFQANTLQIYTDSKVGTWQSLPKLSPEEGNFTGDICSILLRESCSNLKVNL